MPAKDGPASPADNVRAVAIDVSQVATTASPSESDQDAAAKFVIAVERNRQAAADVRRVLLPIHVESAFVFRP